MTPCHAEKYREALEGMQQYASRMFPGPIPAWGQAAMQQHAHYYAAQACGENTMKSYGNMSNYAAYGITRRGTGDGRVINTISMAGFAAYSPIVANKWCDVGTFDAMPKDQGYPAYCDCMFPKDIAADANAACKNYKVIAGFKVAPWSVLANIPQEMIDAGAKAAQDAAKQGGTALLQQGTAAAQTAAASVGINLPIITPDQAAALARGKSDDDLRVAINDVKISYNGGTPNPVERPDQAILYAAMVTENNYRVANPCTSGKRDYQYGVGADGRPRCGGRIFGSRPTPIGLPYNPNALLDAEKRLRDQKTGAGAGPNTALIAGGIAVAVAAIFLLKK